VAHAEASAKTLESAVAAAAAELGLRPDQVDVEVIEEAVASTFGVIGSPARVRVTARNPATTTTTTTTTTSPAGEADGDTPRSATADRDTLSTATATPPAGRATAASEPTGAAARPPRRELRDEPVDAEVVGADTELAGDFLEGLLDAMDVDGDITTWIDENGGHIELEGQDLDVLVGPNGETLDALQELTRLGVLRQTRRRARVFLDVNGYRAHRREQLASAAKAAAEQVLQTREVHEFQPMTPAERKAIHDAVAAIEGTRTESLGEEPNRRVIIRPA
jgi:spoIIIJ-associated protein